MKNKSYTEFIQLLFRLKNNSQLYNIEHKSILNTAKALEYELSKLWKANNSINLFFLKTKININGQDAGTEKMIISIAEYFYSRGVLSLRIEKQCEINSLINMFYILNRVLAGSFLISSEEKLALIEQLSGIKVKAIDFSKLKFDNDSNIQTMEDFDFIIDSLLLHNTNEEKREGVEWYVDVMKQSEVAVNSDFRQSFRTITEMLEINEEEMFNSYAINLNNKFYKEETLNEESNFNQYFAKVLDVLTDYTPELQNKVVAKTVDHLDQYIDEKSLENFIKSLPPKFAKSVFYNKMVSGEQVSPSLAKLMNAIVRNDPNYEADSKNLELSDDYKIDVLMDKEDYNRYIDNSYDQMLYGFSMHKVDPSLAEKLSTQILDELEDSGVNRRIIKAFVKLYRDAEDLEEKEKNLISVKFSLEEAIISGDYYILAQVYKYLLATKEKLDSVDQELRKIFLNSDLLKKVSQDFRRDNKNIKSIIKLIRYELDFYLQTMVYMFINDHKEYKIISKILQLNPRLTAKHSMKYFMVAEVPNKNRYKQLLIICQEHFSNQQYLQLLESDNPSIKLFSFNLLAKKSDFKAIQLIKDMYNSNKQDDFVLALTIIADSQLDEFVPQLISEMPKFYYAKAKLPRYKQIVKCLAKFKRSRVAKKYIEKLRKTTFAWPISNLRELKASLRE